MTATSQSTRQILVTSALPYANGPIHLGHMLEYIQTDIWVRFQKMRGHECHYVCADDAHGTPIMLKAQQLGITPEEMIAQTNIEHQQDFSDFGATTNAKVSLHWKTTDNLSLRGSIGTGFRAPTVGQSNASNVSTSLNQEGNLVDQATLAPTNAIALLKGGKQLEAEDSTSFAFGAVFQFDELFVTVDYFNIEVKDRITLSKDFKVTDSDVASLEAIGILDASSFDSVKYFTNDFDTTTKGIDVVANYQVAMFGGDTKYSLAYNWTDTSIDNWNQEYVSETVVKQMEDGLP